MDSYFDITLAGSAVPERGFEAGVQPSPFCPT
jgi:hypothetical protein